MDDNRRQRFRGRGRMRPVGGRPGRPEGGPPQPRPPEERPRQEPPHHAQRSGQWRPEGRGDPMAQRRARDDRVFGALCHGGFFLGWWGLVTTAAIWALRKDWSRSIRLAGVQALAYQMLAQVVFLVLALVACRSAAVTSLSELLDQGGLFALLATQATFPLALAKIVLGGIACLYLLLCLAGFEPSYPIIGFFSRLVLGIKAPKRPEEPAAKPEKAEEKKPEEKPAGRMPSPAPKPEEKPVPRYPVPPEDDSKVLSSAPRSAEEKSAWRPLPKPDSSSGTPSSPEEE